MKDATRTSENLHIEQVGNNREIITFILLPLPIEIYNTNIPI